MFDVCCVAVVVRCLRLLFVALMVSDVCCLMYVV